MTYYWNDSNLDHKKIKPYSNLAKPNKQTIKDECPKLLYTLVSSLRPGDTIKANKGRTSDYWLNKIKKSRNAR